MAKLYMGVDVGTSSMKVAAIEIESDGSTSLVGELSRGYPPGGERDAETWSRMALTMVSEFNPPDPPVAIGFTGQMHSLIPVDHTHRPLSSALLWYDMQGLPYLQRFVDEQCSVKAFVRRTGNLPLPDFTLAKWLYLRATDPELARQVRYLPSAKDSVRWAFDPTPDLVTDPTDAAGTQLYSPFRQAWDSALIAQARIPPHALGRVRPSTALVGRAVGLGRGWERTWLVNGAGDQAACGRAVDATSPGAASLSLGTSGVLAVALTREALPSAWTGDLHLFPSSDPETYQIIATIPALGAGLTWAADLLGVELAGLDALAQEGSRSETPGERAGFFPFLNGMGAPHPDASVRAGFYGLSTLTDRRVLAWIIYQGFAMELKTLVDGLNLAGVPITQVTLSGGACQLPTFVAAIASYLPVPCRFAPTLTGSAVGAALIAADAVLGSDAPRLDVSKPVHVPPRSMDSRWLELRAAYAQSAPVR